MLNSRPYCESKTCQYLVSKVNSRSDSSLVRLPDLLILFLFISYINIVQSKSNCVIDADSLDLNKLAAAGDTARIERIRTQVNGSGDASLSPSSPIYSNSPPPASSPHRPSLSQASAQSQAPPVYGMPPNPSFPTGNSLTAHGPSVQFSDEQPGRLLFKSSPFFTIIRPLTGVVECKGLLHLSIRR
jgi:hypothetical protein